MNITSINRFYLLLLLNTMKLITFLYSLEFLRHSLHPDGQVDAFQMLRAHQISSNSKSHSKRIISIHPLKAVNASEGAQRLNENDKDLITKEDELEQPHHRLHYPTAGGIFDISRGPDHHLINVDHDKLDDLGDKSVNVHEMKLDAVTVTVASFGFLALCFFVFVFMDGGGGLSNLIARIHNS